MRSTVWQHALEVLPFDAPAAAHVADIRATLERRELRGRNTEP